MCFILEPDNTSINLINLIPSFNSSYRSPFIKFGYFSFIKFVNARFCVKSCRSFRKVVKIKIS